LRPGGSRLALRAGYGLTRRSLRPSRASDRLSRFAGRSRAARRSSAAGCPFAPGLARSAIVTVAARASVAAARAGWPRWAWRSDDRIDDRLADIFRRFLRWRGDGIASEGFDLAAQRIDIAG
jgi:hypothetical protein